MKIDEEITEVDYDKVENDLSHERLFFNFGMAFIVLFTLIIVWSLSPCTMTFTNISSVGHAQDLGDEDLQTDPDISPDVSVPVTGV